MRYKPRHSKKATPPAEAPLAPLETSPSDADEATLPKRAKKKSWRVYLYDALILLSLIVIAFSAFQLYKIYSEYEVAEESYSDLMGQVLSPPDTTSAPTEDEYPLVNFEELRAINPEVLGWIYVPNTKISYPLTSGRDNIYYLNHLLDGTRSKNGTIFLDMNNAVDFTDENSVLHGHHMRNGSMFAQIENYKKQEFFDENPYGYLITPEKVFRLEFFAGIVMKASSVPSNFADLEAKDAWVNEMRSDSTFETNPYPTSEDMRFVSLSTCDYTVDDGRYMLSARMVEITPQQ